MAKIKEDLELPWQALLVLILPFVIYLINDQLLYYAGASAGTAPDIAGRPGGYRETSARLQYLAALILFLGVALAAIAALAAILSTLASKARRQALRIGGAFIVVAAILLLPFEGNPLHTPGMASDIGLPDRCATAANSCPAPHYAELISLLALWKWLLLAATASVIFGAVCCMAGARSTARDSARADAIRRQVKRLDLFLGLSALLMVSALLVQFAFLRWPRYAVQDAGFDGHIGAVLLYYGVGYSVFLASYYLPVAWWLFRQSAELGNNQQREGLINDLTTSLTGVARRVATIVAPAATGLLTAWVNLLG